MSVDDIGSIVPYEWCVWVCVGVGVTLEAFDV